MGGLSALAVEGALIFPQVPDYLRMQCTTRIYFDLELLMQPYAPI